MLGPTKAGPQTNVFGHSKGLEKDDAKSGVCNGDFSEVFGQA